MDKNITIVANPSIVLREESDDWALLFEPDSGKIFGLNPFSVFIWKHLDGQYTLEDVVKKAREECDNVPDEAEQHIKDFIDDLLGNNLVHCRP